LVDKTLYISGCLGLDAQSGNLVSGGAVSEARQALVNMGYILEEAGCSYNNVVKCTLLLADINDFAAINDVYKEYFTTNYPARATYQVAALPKAGRFEIEAVAVVGEITDA
jgi:2-iminobutanoate/2-iminopropanoate deaminase